MVNASQSHPSRSAVRRLIIAAALAAGLSAQSQATADDAVLQPPLLQSGELSLDHKKQMVEFSTPQAKPVVILGLPVGGGAGDGTPRLEDLSDTGFSAWFSEWRYLNGLHRAEPVPYLSLPAGRYTAADGTIWEAGHFSLRDYQHWQAQRFTQPFPETPALFLTLQTDNGKLPLTVRARRVGKGNFEAALFTEEALEAAQSGKETVAYLAIYQPQGGGTVGVVNGATKYSVSNIRAAGRAEIFDNIILIQEEQSKDLELRHGPETLSVLKLGDLLFAQDISSSSPDTITLRRYGWSTEEWRTAEWLRWVRRGNLDKIQSLIDAGTDINASNEQGYNALAYAVQGGRPEVVALLLTSGADPNADHPRFGSVLDAALHGKHMGIVKQLIDAGAAVNKTDKTGRTPLMQAATLWNPLVITWLLNAGADPNVQSERAGTALTLAAQAQNIEAARLLLAGGADPSSGQLRGPQKSALRYAIENNDWAMVNLLLDKGADLNRPDATNWLPLFHAAQQSDEQLLDLLLTYKADVNALDQARNNVLMAVSGPNAIAIAKRLLDEGAQANHRGFTGETPLHRAVDNGNAALFDLLVDRGADIKTRQSGSRDVCTFAVERNFPHGLARCLKAGYNPETRLKDGTPLLVKAAGEGNGEMVKVLVEGGADVNAQGPDKSTALIAAVRNGQSRQGQAEIVRMLLEGGADPDIKDQAGHTVEVYATAQWGEDTPKILELLKDH